MKCFNCKSILNTKDCSERESLFFYCNCKSCGKLNKLTIDLDSNSIKSEIVDDNDTKAKSLFRKKFKRYDDEIKKFKYILSKLNNGSFDALTDTLYTSVDYRAFTSFE